MNMKMMAVAVGILVVVLAVVAVVFTSTSHQGETEDYVGTWYQIYEETGTAEETDKPHFDLHEYVKSQKMKPFVIDKFEMHMFKGSYDGMPIVGSILDDYVTFEIANEERDVYAYYEGYFEGDELILNIVDLDKDFSKVLTGSYAVYIHEDSDSVPDLSTPPWDVMDLECTDGYGLIYNTNEDDILQYEEFAPLSLKFVDQNRFISVLKLEYSYIDNPDDIFIDYFVCILNGVYDGSLSYIICGCTDDDVYTGEVSIADEILYIYMDYYTPEENVLGYSFISFSVNYDRGEIDYPENITGSWTAHVYYTFGDEVIKEEVPREKYIVDYNDCFASIEINPVDGKEYIWLGYIKTEFVTITALHDDVYYPLFGYIDEEEMVIYLAGYIGDGEDGSYRAVYVELYPDDPY